MAKPQIPPSRDKCHACGGTKHANPQDCPSAPKD